MMSLIEALPESVEVGTLKLPIDTDFRVWIQLESLLLDETLPQGEKAALALELVFPNPVPPLFIAEALEKILWFFTCGKELPVSPDETDSAVGEEAAYSYLHDAAYIYAAFLEQYGIDLFTESLHWWQFQALFKSLGSDTLFVKIMGYRAVKLTADMPAAKREFLAKMKKLYALPVSKHISEQQAAIEEALMHGGDLSGIL